MANTQKIYTVNQVVDTLTADPSEYLDGDKIHIHTINIVFFPSKTLTRKYYDDDMYYFYPYSVSVVATVDGVKKQEKIKKNAIDFAIRCRKRKFVSMTPDSDANVLTISTEEQKYKNHVYYKYSIKPLNFSKDSKKYKAMKEDLDAADTFEFHTSLNGEDLIWAHS